MFSFIEYLSYWWNYNQETIKSDKPSLLISSSDLLAVKLKTPSKIRDRPVQGMSNFRLNDLNNEQLKQILNVKLKSTKNKEIEKTYEQRHPVLKELLEKIQNK